MSFFGFKKNSLRSYNKKAQLRNVNVLNYRLQIKGQKHQTANKSLKPKHLINRLCCLSNIKEIVKKIIVGRFEQKNK